jgi:acyl-coenzyme A synthetase/AMP-(fatty) acid ligase
MTASAQKMNFCREVAAMALQYKDNLAIVNVERNRCYTFPEYHRLTNRITNMCRDRLGLRQGERPRQSNSSMNCRCRRSARCCAVRSRSPTG